MRKIHQKDIRLHFIIELTENMPAEKESAGIAILYFNDFPSEKAFPTFSPNTR